MTLEEKIAQIGGLGHRESDFIDENGTFDPVRAEPIFRNGAGMAGRAGLHRTARQGAELYNTTQRYFVEHTRLGIPALFSDEALHGFWPLPLPPCGDSLIAPSKPGSGGYTFPR